MNKKMYDQISQFIDQVGDYIYMEYAPKYYKLYTRDKNLVRIFDTVGSYYMGGNNVPDTARYLVDFIKTNYE